MNKSQKGIVDRKKLTMKKMVIVMTVLVCIAVVVVRSAYVNGKEIEMQMKQNLQDVARQNAEVLQAKLDSQYQLLLALSNELAGVTEDTIEEKLSHFEIFIEDFQLKRFAMCFPDGTTYSTDGEVKNLSYREFYQRGMEGKCTITGNLSDALNPKHDSVNVMSIPIYNADGEVSGVFGLTYDTEKLNQTLQIMSFEGKGYGCIINENGEIMSSHGDDIMKVSANLTDDVLGADEKNSSQLEELKQLITQRAEGNGIVYLPEKLYYHIVPVDLMNGNVTWYIMTMLPADILEDRTEPIQTSQYKTVSLVMILVVIGALLVIAYIREQQEQMLSFAYEDPVTHGANYPKFHLDMEAKSDCKGYIAAMDIANFNNISVVAGENAENSMIKETWKIINSELDKEELAAHIYGDMFLIYLQEQDEGKILQRMCHISEKIYEKAKDFAVYGVQARYGIYRLTGKETLESAYNKAKLAREFAVVKLGKSYAFYSELDRVKMQFEKQLEDRFPEAMEKEEFEVWYQPKYSAQSCKVVGSEALVRWRTENGEMISPGQFIPLFEHNGMIVKLDEYMFSMVCKQQKKWLDEGKAIYPVSVNISRASLYCMDVHKRYYSIMQEYQIEPKYIQLEVTETVMEERADICELLNRFRDMGIKILMDDFGTGYSALATLSLHCFDTLKLDKTLIDHIGDKDGETMLYHIIRMGQQMGLHITAEGVEEQTQLQFLQNMKCDDIQGFYFSKPIPVHEYENILQ